MKDRQTVTLSKSLTGAMAGAGFFAQFHADAWQRMPGVDITAVADPDAARAHAFAEKWDIPRVYSGVDEMLYRERPAFLDIVTRPDEHQPLAAIAAQRGIHVICQKPMAPTLEECHQMASTANAAGTRLVVHENWRWQPWYRELHRLIEAGRFGRIFHVGFRMRTGDGLGPEPYQTQPYFREMPRLLIYETLVHFLDTFRLLAGEIKSVFCSTARLNPVIAGEDSTLIQLRFEGAAHGLIDANRISGIAPSEVAFGELRLEGERAAARMSADGNLWITDYGRPEAPHRFHKPDTGYKGDSVLAMQQHFIDCLASGQPAESEAENYLRTVAAVEACYRSAATGQPEQLS